jgi:hypothetical protein
MFSQGVFFTFGKTITGYDYTNSEGESIDELKRGLGNFFEVGGVFALNRNQHLNYEVGITLSQFNSKATIDRHFYSWETSYIGIQNVINYNFFKFSTFNFSRNNSLLLSDFNLFVKGGLNVSYIIYGEQIVGSRTYDISKNEEFKGFFVQPLMGGWSENKNCKKYRTKYWLQFFKSNKYFKKKRATTRFLWQSS